MSAAIQHLDMAADVERALWADACLAARVFALFMRAGQFENAGVVLKAHAGPVRDAWIDHLKALLPQEMQLRSVPSNISMERLLGGLDLGLTLAKGTAVEMRGVLADAHENILFMPAAGLTDPAVLALIAGAMDSGDVRVERDGLSTAHETRFGMICFDEGETAEDALSPVLTDRVMLHIDLRAVSVRAARKPALNLVDHPLYDGIAVPEEMRSQLCQLPTAFGLQSMRPAMQMIHLAKALCHLAGDDSVNQEHVSDAVRLGLVHRAQQLPPPPEESPEDQTEQQSPPDPQPPESQADGNEKPEDPNRQQSEMPDDMVLESAQAALPPGLLAYLKAAGAANSKRASMGRKGARKKGGRRGRPLASRKGELSAGKRLDLIATLRAAAPFQKARASAPASKASKAKVHVRASDFHIRRYQERSETSTIFVVDASGSTALNRLREAKGAVELLLGESYARRDHVALIGFRGREAQLLLPPTRALVRAKRSLAALPGGGGTPLASGIEAAIRLAEEERGNGRDASIVVMTDGSANVNLQGAGGRKQASEDAEKCARMVAYLGIPAILVDIGRRPQGKARALAEAMQATYLPMPFAGAQELCLAVTAGR